MSMVKMNSNEKFRYCLNQTVIPMFKMMFIDAVEGKILNRFGYFAILGYFLICLGAILNGMYFMDANSTVTLLGTCYLMGIVQVKILIQ